MDEVFHHEIMNLFLFLKIVYLDQDLIKIKFNNLKIILINLPLGVPSTLLHGPIVEFHAIIE
jgi:hypothetical protein